MTSSASRKLVVSIERWPIAGAFTISRGAKTEAVTIVATVSQGDHTGHGECVPYPRYGETPEATLAALEAMREPIARGLDRVALQAAMPAVPHHVPAPRPSRVRSAHPRRWRRQPPRPRAARC
jgi:L-alanine-DL-glutamate epimerase-like enolase superfamily enzyme